MQQWGITRCFITVTNARIWNNHCCKSWSVQAWKLLGNVHVSKPVPNLCTACVHAWTLLVHWSYFLATRPLYTGGVWALVWAIYTFPSRFQPWALQLLQQWTTSFYVFSPTYIAVKTLGLLHPYFCHLSCIPLYTWPVTNFQGCFQSLNVVEKLLPFINVSPYTATKHHNITCHMHACLYYRALSSS